MDYTKELEDMANAGSYWKALPGKFKVKALTELEKAEPYIKKHEDGSEEKTEQSRIVILVDGEEKVWTFGKGKTPASTYGQLVQIAVDNNNTLIGKEFTVIVKSDGNKNNYTIVD